MISIFEEIATQDNGVYRLQFGRVKFGEYDRFFMKINGTSATFKPGDMAQFLAKINAYADNTQTLFRVEPKSGPSTGKTDATQTYEKAPPVGTSTEGVRTVPGGTQ